MTTLTLITSNPHKAAEASRLLGFGIRSVDLALTEIQGSSLEAITWHKLAGARRHLTGPVLVEDVALGFDILGGFPGPYIKWLIEAAGGEGLARLATALENPLVRARCCLGWWTGLEEHFFVGEVAGRVASEPRGSRGFGWDAWFVPEGSGKTFGEMSSVDKDRISHRALAYGKLVAAIESSPGHTTSPDRDVF